jgi:hypothetical protein
MALLASSSHSEDDDSPAPCLLADPSGGIQTVETRHSHVHQYYLRAKCLSRLHRLDPVVNSNNLVSHEHEKHRHRDGVVTIVVRHEPILRTFWKI